MESKIAVRFPNGGGYAPVVVPATRVDAARWLRDHSSPADVVATNAHCLYVVRGYCDSRSFWISAYSERRVLVEGWIFAPRAAELAAASPLGVYTPFWDQPLQKLNDTAFRAPTADVLRQLARRARGALAGRRSQLAGRARIRRTRHAGGQGLRERASGPSTHCDDSPTD
jgi:hypothetical protein